MPHSSPEYLPAEGEARRPFHGIDFEWGLGIYLPVLASFIPARLVGEISCRYV